MPIQTTSFGLPLIIRCVVTILTKPLDSAISAASVWLEATLNEKMSIGPGSFITRSVLSPRFSCNRFIMILMKYVGVKNMWFLLKASQACLSFHSKNELYSEKHKMSPLFLITNKRHCLDRCETWRKWPLTRTTFLKIGNDA